MVGSGGRSSGGPGLLGWGSRCSGVSFHSIDRLPKLWLLYLHSLMLPVYYLDT